MSVFRTRKNKRRMSLTVILVLALLTVVLLVAMVVALVLFIRNLSRTRGDYYTQVYPLYRMVCVMMMMMMIFRRMKVTEMQRMLTLLFFRARQDTQCTRRRSGISDSMTGV